MTRSVRLDDGAVKELRAAHARYDAVAPGLGEELADELGLLLEHVAELPKSFPLATGAPRQLGVRRAVLPRFPFSVFYLELDKEILVLAVAHQLRRPGYWRRRAQRRRAH